MIYGIGTDICDIRRIRAALERRGERFAQTVLGDAELAVYHERRSRWPDRAVRYLPRAFRPRKPSARPLAWGFIGP